VGISKNGLVIIVSYLALSFMTASVVVLFYFQPDDVIYNIVGSWFTSILVGSILLLYSPLKKEVRGFFNAC